MNRIILTVAGATLGLSFQIMAAPSKLCTEPVQTICAGVEAMRNESRELAEEVIEKTLKDVLRTPQAKGLEQAFARIDADEGMADVKTKEEVQDLFRALYLYYRGLREQLGLSSEEIREYYLRTSKALEAAIDAQKGLLDSTKKAMKDRIRRTQVLSFEAGIQSKLKVEDRTMSLVNQFLNVCHLKGVKGHARNTQMEIEMELMEVETKKTHKAKFDFNVIALCPTHFYEQKALKNGLGTEGTLPHEFGHSIDDKRFAVSYRPMQACVEEKYRTLPTWPKNAEGEALPTATVFREVVADYWVSETLAQLVGSEKDQAAREQAVQRALGYYCSIGSGPRHLDGQLRVELMLRNPNLRRTLGCTAEMPSCTL